MEEIVKSDNIGNLIYEIRGKQVMLDSDLAKLYQCRNGTKAINLAVKRHINRFPERFMFQLTREESEIFWFQIETKKSLRFQFETSKNETQGGRRYQPYVFTEQGVAMLATVIKTAVAEEMSVRIMDAFVAMRHYIGDTSFRLSSIETKIIEHDNNIKLLQQSFDKFEQKQETNAIFFNGQIYDAYSKICEIFKEAKERLTIIDGYADRTTLNIIKTLKIPITIITSSKAPLSKQDVKKYNVQYNNLKVIRNDTFHDRYFILDDETVYHCGASINYIGKRTFSITRLSDKNIIDLLRKRVLEICKQ